MIPALALELVLACDATRAITLPSPDSVCQTNRNWSEVPVMSAPPALIVHVPVFGSNDWLPAGDGLPMSAHVHEAGQGLGGAGAGGPAGSATSPIVAVLTEAGSPAVTTSPASAPEPRFRLTDEPGTGSQS